MLFSTLALAYGEEAALAFILHPLSYQLVSCKHNNKLPSSKVSSPGQNHFNSYNNEEIVFVLFCLLQILSLVASHPEHYDKANLACGCDFTILTLQ